ncbi:hypothetical protein pdam_00005296 [Pocillopora damicornis]|uniref:Uncharacterized protein n=1 Tax=Pocillopora damicornis TaxID=46731 RepID=A0A3M6TS05_POCDA|nr:hypothetical protein pdam_00005296 [Pocillopora damicornis]
MAANRRARQYTSKISASSLAAHGEPLFLCPTAGAGIAPAVMSVISGVAVAVTVTAELPAGVAEAAGVFIGATERRGATKGVATGYVAAGTGDVVGKLGLNGFMAGDAAVVLRFKEVIPDSKPLQLCNSLTSEKPSGAGDDDLACRVISGGSLIVTIVSDFMKRERERNIVHDKM